MLRADAPLASLALGARAIAVADAREVVVYDGDGVTVWYEYDVMNATQGAATAVTGGGGGGGATVVRLPSLKLAMAPHWAGALALSLRPASTPFIL